MKYAIVLSLIFCTVTYSQTIFSNISGVDSSIALKRGIYASFQEFKINKPSNNTPFDIRETVKSNDLFSKRFVACKLMIHKDYKQHFTKDTPVWGFCDGKKVYIRQFEIVYSNARKVARALYVNPRNANYYPITFLGRYSIFTAVIKVSADVLTGQWLSYTK